MSRRILHVIQSTTPQAGEVSSVLGGLLAVQRRWGHHVQTLSQENDELAGQLIDQAELVHVHGAGGSIFRRAWPLLKAMNKRYIVSTYASKLPRFGTLTGRADRWFSLVHQGRALRRAWCLHALTESESEFLRRRRWTRRVKVLPMGVSPLDDDVPYDEALADTYAGRRMMLYLGPLHPGIGLVPFLRACVQVADHFTDLHLVLAGEQQRGWVDILQAAIRRQGFEGRTTLIASPSLPQMETLLRDMAVLVAPMSEACCPVSPLQALARAKPVVVSPGCHLPEVALRNAGWVVEARRKPLEHTLREVFDRSPEQLQDMGQRGAQLIRDRYAWDRLAPEYLNLYLRVMQ